MRRAAAFEFRSVAHVGSIAVEAGFHREVEIELQVPALPPGQRQAKLWLCYESVASDGALLFREDSIYLNKLVKAVQTTLGWAGKPRVMWLDADGETHELASQEAFARFVDHEWCSLPWVLHVCEGAAASLQSLTLHDRAKGMRTTAVDAPGSYRPRSYC